MPSENDDINLTDRTTDRLHRALNRMSDQQRCRILRTARKFQSRLPHDVDPEDLVQDAFERLLTGTRSWDFARFDEGQLEAVVNGIVRSIASSYYRTLKLARQHQQVLVSIDADTSETSAALRLQARTPSPEQRVLDGEAVDRQRALLADGSRDDPILLAIMIGLADGLKPAEIQEDLNITRGQYNHRVSKLQKQMKMKMTKVQS